eukprot:TRINITY_DN18060_c0_g1_i3.p1 TRINITY_DN18060_c0_g1~~TRINITY_DN18060_c0_g1_i3.p1  ORF type:complete len:101 (-),score=9.24 TRINITY_DN18060_c0_g1_i3:140-442(-)
MIEKLLSFVAGYKRLWLYNKRGHDLERTARDIVASTSFTAKESELFALRKLTDCMSFLLQVYLWRPGLPNFGIVDGYGASSDFEASRIHYREVRRGKMID